jgi:hypothetical protein
MADEKNSALIKEVYRCRVCGFSPLEDIISFGNLYVTNFVASPEAEQIRAPLDLVLCNKSRGGCGLLQLRHTFSQDHMYKQYWYRSGINRTMTEELRGIAKIAEKMVGLKQGDYVIDIGSNDSTLLRGYPTEGVNLIGFEPAKNLQPYAEPGVTRVIYDYFNYPAWKENFGEVKAKIITAIAMFYDLDDPNAFLKDIVSCLDGEGIFIVQQNYLPYMLERNIFDNVSHEHLEYYSLTTFKELLGRHNLEVFDIELNDVNGGSMRTYIRHQNLGRTIRESPGAADRVEEILKKEAGMGLEKKETYENFAKRVQNIKKTLYKFIKEEIAKGKKIYAYGASTRGNTTLRYCGLDYRLITAVADRNPDKWGRKTVGTLIPITSEAQARAEKPDYFWVLPWQFLKEFREREADYLKNNGKFIVPLPEFRIIRED